MSSAREIEQLEAEATYYRNRVALLRARLYSRALGSSARLQELERHLERVQRRLHDARAPAPASATVPPASALGPPAP